MIPLIDYSLFVDSTWSPDPLKVLGIKVVARIHDFPAFLETSDSALLRGPWIGLSDEAFFQTEIGSALKYQAEQRLILKWNELNATEESVQ